MVHSFSPDRGFLLDILSGLYLVLTPENGSKIRLPMKTTVTKSHNMITIPSIRGRDEPSRQKTSTAMQLENPKTNAFRHRSIIIFTNPFRDFSGHLALEQHICSKRPQSTCFRQGYSACHRNEGIQDHIEGRGDPSCLEYPAIGVIGDGCLALLAS
jgi:hypothetical protein